MRILAQDCSRAVLNLPDHVTEQARKVCTEGYKAPAIHKTDSTEDMLCSALCRIVHKYIDQPERMQVSSVCTEVSGCAHKICTAVGLSHIL